MNTTEQILQLKKNIQQAETNKSNYEGKLSMLLERLKKEFNLDSFDEIENSIVEKEESLTNLKSKLETKIKEFKEEYPL